jgi:phosphonate transport system permease protein
MSTQDLSGAAVGFEESRRLALRRQRLHAALGIGAFSLLLAISLQRSEVFALRGGGDPLARIADFFQLMTPTLRADALFEGRRVEGSLGWWFYDLPMWLGAIRQTVEMAILATVLGAVGAALAAFGCARNLNSFAPARFAIRRVLEAIRTMPDIIMALIMVAAFGVGPLAGVIALSITTMGSLGKLFSETNEEVDPRQLEALDAAGAGILRKIRYGVIPQVLPQYASYALIRLEGNLAAAAALGIVGAGGIGLELQRAITYTEFDTYLAILMLIVGMIFILDMASEAIRHRLLGLDGEARPASRRWGGLPAMLLTIGGGVLLVLIAIDLKLAPDTLLSGFERLIRMIGTAFPPTPDGQLLRILRALGETFAMAFLGTVIAVLVAVPIGILGAKTVVSQPILHFVLRRGLDVFRGVPVLVWALVMVSLFGLGPFGGVIAIALADIPNLSKLFSESLEACDPTPTEGVRAAGGSRLVVMRYGLAPQMIPVMTSQSLFYLEGNFRHAGVLGIVGAGGIGFELDERLRVFAFDEAFFIILLYMATVAALDAVSSQIRKRLA